MLETLRIWPKIRERIITGPLGPYCDEYLSWLEKAGYSRLGIRRHIHLYVKRRACGVALKSNVELLLSSILIGLTPSALGRNCPLDRG